MTISAARSVGLADGSAPGGLVARMSAAAVRAVAEVRRTPLAAGFAVVLLITTIVLRNISGDQNLLRWASTNVDNLTDRPIRSLVASAFLLPNEVWLPYAVVIALCIVPMERRYGGLRTLAVFASGHVLATLVTEGWVALAIRAGSLPTSEGAQLDVGVSYGLWTTAGAVFFLLPRRRRLIATALAAAVLVVQAALDPDMTAAGHLLSFGIGVAWWSVLARVGRRRSARVG